MSGPGRLHPIHAPAIGSQTRGGTLWRLLACRSMRRPSSFIRPPTRLFGDLLSLVPALLTGAGVFLIVAGLFYYLQPVAAGSYSTASAGPSEPIAVYSLPPLESSGPSGGSAPVQAAIATRVVVLALKIDLPVVASPAHEQFPLCNAAEYLSLDKLLGYPGQPQAIYLYAHARKSMFLPLLTASKVNNGAAMIGMWVEVYTDDNQRHVYQVTRVLRHVAGSAALDEAANATTDQLWLQTSEGPVGDPNKLQVVAEPIGVLAASAADAHPAGKGNVCPDAPICTTSDGGGCRRR